jgi:GxxExxY protein
MKKITLLHSDITDDILKAFFDVYNSLGYGFLEKVYENSMVHVLKTMNRTVKQQHPITVFFDGIVVGEYFTDLLVDAAFLLS